MSVKKKIEATFPIGMEPCRRAGLGVLSGGFYLTGRDRDANLIAYVCAKGASEGESFETNEAFADWIVRTLNEAAAKVAMGVDAEFAWASPAEAIDVRDHLQRKNGPSKDGPVFRQTIADVFVRECPHLRSVQTETIVERRGLQTPAIRCGRCGGFRFEDDVRWFVGSRSEELAKASAGFVE